MKKRSLLFLAAALVLLAVFGYSVYRLLSMHADYAAEAYAHSSLLVYRPELPAGLPEETAFPLSGDLLPPEEALPQETDPPETVNEEIVALRRDHPNAVGWVTVPGTDVDYPFVQGADNAFFLRRDLDGNDLYAGVPFLDYRCPADFSGGNAILYGHNLRNGSMFGTLERFKDRAFFDEHRFFYVFLENRTIRAEILACVVSPAEEAAALYVTEPAADYLSALTSLSRCSLDLSGLPRRTRFITLSTCDYETDDGRVILIGRILSRPRSGASTAPAS